MITFAVFDDGTASEIVLGDFHEPSGDAPLKCHPITMQSKDVIDSAQTAFWAAYHVLKSLHYIESNERFAFPYQFKESRNIQVLGSSAGLGFCLKFAQVIHLAKTGQSLGFSIAATGVITDCTAQAQVTWVTGIKAKFKAAKLCMKSGDRFFYPSENEEEITREMREEALQGGIRMIPVGTPKEAVARLLEKFPQEVEPPEVIVDTIKKIPERSPFAKPSMWGILGALVLFIGIVIFLMWCKPLTATSELIASSEAQSTDRGLKIIPSGGGFRILFTSPENCYLYLYQLDSHKNVTRLFPNPDASQVRNPVISGRSHQFPDGKEWFVLDQNTGTEKIFVFAFRHPAQDLEEAFSRFDSTAVGAEKERFREELIRRLEDKSKACASAPRGCSGASDCFYKEHAFWHK